MESENGEMMFNGLFSSVSKNHREEVGMKSSDIILGALAIGKSNV